MTLRNTARSYGSMAKTFHWLTALLIITIIPVGLVANDLAHDIRDSAIATTSSDLIRVFFLFSLHKTLGVVIFLVALARILWAMTQPKPGLLNADNRVESFAAETVHWLLYGSLVLVPLTGWIGHAATSGFAPIRWPFGQDLPFVPKDPDLAATFAGLHGVLEKVLVVALILHIAGALKHHFVDRDTTLRRMLPGGTGGTGAAIPPAHRHSLLPPIAALALWGGAIAAGLATGAIAPLLNRPSGQAAQTTPSTEASVEPAAKPATKSTAETLANWQVTDGTLGLSITQMGDTVDGSFADWSANITFDETAGPGPVGTVDVTIAISSLSLGALTAQAVGADFLDAKTFPEAHFTADITRTETGFIATGPLVIHGTSLPVSLPFTLTIDADTARMSGQMSVARLDFAVGTTTPDAGTLGLDVDITINLTARRDAE